MQEIKSVAVEFQCLSRQTIKWNQTWWIGDRAPSGSFQCLSRQTIKWNVTPHRIGPRRRVVSMPQSANDQVERSPPGFPAPTPPQFQCLSRQTIKWNGERSREWVRVGYVSMPQSANDQVERRKWPLVCGARRVSMPQSANDQVERIVIMRWPKNGASFNASVGKRSSGTWAVDGDGRMYLVSMPQSANDQVEQRSCTFSIPTRIVSMPQSANDQVELPDDTPAVRGAGGFNASVGKRSSGTWCGCWRRAWT